MAVLRSRSRGCMEGGHLSATRF